MVDSCEAAHRHMCLLIERYKAYLSREEEVGIERRLAADLQGGVDAWIAWLKVDAASRSGFYCRLREKRAAAVEHMNNLTYSIAKTRLNLERALHNYGRMRHPSVASWRSVCNSILVLSVREGELAEHRNELALLDFGTTYFTPLPDPHKYAEDPYSFSSAWCVTQNPGSHFA